MADTRGRAMVKYVDKTSTVHSVICRRERLTLLRLSISTPNHCPLISWPASASSTTMKTIVTPQRANGPTRSIVAWPMPMPMTTQNTTATAKMIQSATRTPDRPG